MPRFEKTELVCTAEADAVVERCRARLSKGEVRLLAIDGRDGSGKSSFARYLAFSLGVTCYETDEFLVPGQGWTYRPALGKMLRFHLARNLPVIVEGVLAAKTLKSFGLEPDHLIRVRKVGHSGDCLSSGEYEQYECAFEDDDSVILPCAEVEGNGYNCSISGCKDGPTCNFCKVPTEAYEKGTKLWHD